MKSGLRRFLDKGKPPIKLSRTDANRNHMFNLSVGKGNIESYLRTYHRSGTVQSIVSLLSQSAATPEWHLYKKAPRDARVRYTTTDRGSDERVEVVQHAALQLLQCPNDFQTRFEFFESSQQYMELAGEFFWVLDYHGATFPTSMWLLRPDRMEPVPSLEGILSGWIYTDPDGVRMPLKASEVIHEKIPDPLDPFRGAGPVSAIMPNIEQQRYATEYQRNLFISGAQPDGVISVPNTLNEEEYDQLVDRWREAHQGVARAGRVAVLENGSTWTQRSATNRDMEYTNLRAVNRDEIREGWRMHKSLLGTVEDVNRANAQTAEEVFVTWSTIPRLNRRRDTLNRKLLPLFGTAGQGVEFDYEDPSPGNREVDNAELATKSSAAKTLVDAGYDPEDALNVVGLPPMKFTGMIGTAPAAQPEDAFQPAEQQLNRQTIAISNKDTGAKVYQSVADDYPPAALAWIHHVDWKGPVSVPLGHIDATMNDMDGADPDHVQHFVKKLQKGKKLKPLLMVKTPKSSTLRLVDGHHRYLAYAELGMPVRAYIGSVNSEHGPWEGMHVKQFDRNEQGKPDANLMVDFLRQEFVPSTVGQSWNRG